MSTQDFSKWSMEQLRNRLAENSARIHEEDQRGLPVQGLIEENNRILAAMDKLMEQFKGTEFYDGYWKARQIKGEWPQVPPSFDSRWQ